MNFTSTASALEAPAVQGANGSPLRIAIVGHVDHGKSTLIGRLFHEMGALPEGKLESITQACERRGVEFAWAFLVDALKAERDQGVTIDSAQMWFRTRRRDYVIIDAPGHREFVKNMVSGAASAEAALLVIDAEEGVREQTRRHGYLLQMIGVRQLAVVVNKMDKVGYAEERFVEVAAECSAYLGELGLDVEATPVIPISAERGCNVVSRSLQTPWYAGLTVVDALDSFVKPDGLDALPLRLPVQSVYKYDHRRILAGWILSGRVGVGDEVLFSPSNKRAHVASIEVWHAKEPILTGRAGQSIGVTLDQPVFIERGEMISHVHDAPVLSNVFGARLFWFGREPLTAGCRYKLRLGTAEHAVTVDAITSVINVDDFSTVAADQVNNNEIAEVVLRSRGLVALDESAGDVSSGRFVLIDEYDIVGGGLVSVEGYPDARQSNSIKSTNITRIAHRVPMQKRWHANGHKSGILWLTGLSGAGKSTLAFLLEQRLHMRGFQVYALDGDNVRHSLCADLDFSPEARAENIRRVGAMALAFAEAGTLVIAAFISPHRSDRRRVRRIAGNLFHEVYIKADVTTCERRDPKGLYQKARRGEIADFTGISSPYEEPSNPELVLDTAAQTEEESLDALLEYVDAHFGPRTLGDHPTDLTLFDAARPSGT